MKYISTSLMLSFIIPLALPFLFFFSLYASDVLRSLGAKGMLLGLLTVVIVTSPLVGALTYSISFIRPQSPSWVVRHLVQCLFVYPILVTSMSIMQNNNGGNFNEFIDILLFTTLAANLAGNYIIHKKSAQ